MLEAQKLIRLRHEPVLRLVFGADKIEIWPDEEFSDKDSLYLIDRQLGHWGFGLTHDGPRPLTFAEQEVTKSWRGGPFEAVGKILREGGVKFLRLPPEISRHERDSAAFDAFSDELAKKGNCFSLSEIEEMASTVRFQHLPPGVPAHYYFF